MGTTFELHAVVPCGSVNDTSRMLEVKNILDRYETALSLYQSDSEISRLNRIGWLLSPSPVFLEAIRLALQHSAETEG
ncbi:MAG: FAD:protein FMN transferase, partial [Bdellovibrionales bacterium]|nr:FAD:protein FMN transferase [Bdellovibrionales bacterium]